MWTDTHLSLCASIHNSPGIYTHSTSGFGSKLSKKALPLIRSIQFFFVVVAVVECAVCLRELSSCAGNCIRYSLVPIFSSGEMPPVLYVFIDTCGDMMCPCPPTAYVCDNLWTLLILECYAHYVHLVDAAFFRECVFIVYFHRHVLIQHECCSELLYSISRFSNILTYLLCGLGVGFGLLFACSFDEHRQDAEGTNITKKSPTKA